MKINKTLMMLSCAAALLLVGSALLLGCAADGTLATPSKPVDKTATITATCDSVVKANAAFQTFAATKPGIIDQNGMDTEGAALAVLGLHTNLSPPLPADPGSVCAVPYAGDINVAETTAITTLIKVTLLLSNWNK